MMLADLRYRLRAVFRRGAVERELEEEVRFHLEREVEKHVRAGVDHAEAVRRARLEFGGVEQIKEDTRRVRGVALIDALVQDLRYGWRGMRARPGFTIAVVLTLGLGIGANVAMFGVVDRLLVRAPAFLQAPDRVHRLYMTYTWDGAEHTDRYFEYLNFDMLRRTATAYDAIAGFTYPTLAIGAGAEARELQVAAVSASFFDLFDARPELGRFFTAEEDETPAGRAVAVLGLGFWQSEYGGRTTVLGEQLHIGESVYTVIGIAPRGFVGVTDGPSPVAFIPATAYAHARMPDYHESYGWSWLEIVARRRSGAAVAAATADMTEALRRMWSLQNEQVTWLRPTDEAKPRATIVPVHNARGPDAGPAARVASWVMGVAFIVLLVAAANVVNLLMTRAIDRRRETALRLALGVSRSRLVQQLLMETLLLALLGGAAGLAMAQWGGGTLRALFLREEDIGAVASDARTLIFAAILTISVALLSGLAPALQTLRAEVGSVLKAGMRQSTYRRSALRTGLLVFQAALCVVLLVGAALFLKSVENVRSYRLGYDVEPVLIIDVNMRGTELAAAQRIELADRLVETAAAMPGVLGATVAASVPFYGFEGRGAPHVPGRDSLNLLGRYMLQAASPSYFETFGTRILHGRAFSKADVAGAPPVVIVSQEMAAAIWPGEDALGRQMRIGDETMPLLTIVGIAEDIDARQIGGQPELWYYLPFGQYKQMFGDAPSRLLVRVSGNATEHAAAVRKRLQAELPGSAYIRATPLEALITQQRRSWRFGATMFAVFAGLALVLASIGLYSVITYGVAQRTRELGVRMALGASALGVIRIVVMQGVLFAAIGIAAGTLIALLAARWIEPLLFEASATDPAIHLVVAALLLAVAVAATIRPALRATRVDPSITLRAE